jgi:hypothetical protein
MQTCIRPSAGAHCKATVGQVLSTTEATTSAPSAHQTSYGWLREVLRGAARAEVVSGPRIGTIGCRTTGALDALMTAHPVDRRGRCRSCRRPGRWFGRRRRTCLVYWTAHYWLFQPVEALRFRAGAAGIGSRRVGERPIALDPVVSHPDAASLPRLARVGRCRSSEA